MPYLRFAAMIGTSTVVMFALMYLNTYAWDHVTFSETRTYMAVIMDAAMAIIMLSYIFSMYRRRAINIARIKPARRAPASRARLERHGQLPRSEPRRP